MIPRLPVRQRPREREGDLIATDPSRVPPLALPPTAENAVLGSLSGAEFERAAQEAARTAPPRENGGNQDIKNLSRGSRVFYPVFVPGAKLSVGDLHFSQGDGEITFCGAIEMGGYIDLHVDVIKGGMEAYGVETPVFIPGRVEPRYSEYLAFAGLSVTESGEQRYLDSHLAYQRACLNAINYLTKFEHAGAGVSVLCAPIGSFRCGGYSELVCDGVHPDQVFDFDPRPSAVRRSGWIGVSVR